MSVAICWDMDRVAGGMSASGLESVTKTVSGSFRRSRTEGAAGSAGSGSTGVGESDVGPESVPDLELDPELDSELDPESDSERE